MTGEFFDADSVEDFVGKFHDFHEHIDAGAYDPKKIRFHALGFRKERFMEEFDTVIREALKK